MRKLRFICLISVIVLLISSCSSGVVDNYDFSDNALGCEIKINLRSDNMSADQYKKLCAEAMFRVRSIEGAVSRTDKNSDLCRFNASETGIEDADVALQCVLSAAFYACELTDGAFDPTIGTLTALWSENKTPSDAQIEEALVHSGQSLVGISGANIAKVDEKLALDLDGIARGYALEKAVGVLSNSGVTVGTCELADSIGFIGTPPEGAFKVEETDHNDRPLARLSIDGGFISRSKRSDGENGALVIDPITGKPASGDLRCVIVRSESGAYSDALATALLSATSLRAVELWRKCAFDFDAVLVTDDTVYVTGRFASDGAFELLNDEYKLKKITEK